jgi:hypothetical protein
MLTALLASAAILGPRHIDAVRIATPPSIDGRLDELVWTTAPVAGEFVESTPRPGAAASLHSEARVLMDDESLYIGLTYFDPEPGRIQAPLARRDDETTSDWAFVEIDSRHDRRSGFSFGVNPAGVQVDGLWLNDTQYDASWNAVWEAAAQIDGHGWTAEFRIPFSQLAFHLPHEAKTLQWGINFYRYSPSHGESSNWSPRYRGLGGVVSHFNDLHLPAPPGVGRLEITPYAASRRAAGTAERSTTRAGADLKAGLGSSFTLTGTLKPDFGQVEADPSQVNLSAFELFQTEQRPFFLEGSEVFQMPTGLSFATRETNFADESPFYSRRIGQDGEIRGAAKVSGQTSAGWTVGLFTAASGGGTATVARAMRDSIGFFLSDARRDTGHATVAGGDVRRRFGGGQYELRSWALASRNGMSAETRLSRLDGDLTWNLTARAVSPHFDMNALGYQRNTDWLLLAATWSYNRSRPGKAIRNWTVGSTGLGVGWTWQGQPRNRVLDVYASIDTRRYWKARLAARHERSALSTTWLRGGPALRLPPRTAVVLSILTDQRRPTYASVDAWVSREEGNGSHGFNITPLLNVRSSKRLQWSVGTTWQKDVVAWQSIGLVAGSSVVGRVHQDTLSITMRADYLFTPHVSLQAYAQPFRSIGRYDRFQRLAGSNRFVPIDFGETGLPLPDSEERTRHADVVLRWEYRPGSFLTGVWNSDRRTNIVLVKVSRRFGA